MYFCHFITLILSRDVCMKKVYQKSIIKNVQTTFNGSIITVTYHRLQTKIPNGNVEYLRFALPIKNVLTHLRFIGIELFGYTRDKLFNLLAIFTFTVLQTRAKTKTATFGFFKGSVQAVMTHF